MATAPNAQYLYSRILRRTTGTQATVKRERPVAVISRLMNVLLLIASPLAGYMRDVQGTYNNAFLILAALNFLGGVLFLFAKRPKLPATQGRTPVSPRAIPVG